MTLNTVYALRTVSESESERDFSRERATIQTSESKRAKFKTAHDFSRATACDVSRILAIVAAPVCACLSVHHTHVTVKTVQARIMKIFTVRCHKLDSSFRILETVRDSAKVTIRPNRL